MKVEFLIPDYVQKTARMLIKEGYQCHLVGGALRDVVLGKTPHDYDLATDAIPDKMLNIFPKAVATGARFGQVTVLIRDSLGETFEVEVTTFRTEDGYQDGRRPTGVQFISNLDEDLGRRDFTFNAMALNLDSANLDGKNTPKTWEVYDPYGGIQDLGLRVVRAVGIPIDRFREDGLRGIRACRLASELGFDLEHETYEAIKMSIPVAKMVSKERVRDEFMKLLMNSPMPSVGIELLRQTGLLEIIIPELLEGRGQEQKINHAHDVYTHSLKTCDVAPDRIKLAALLHDIAKPRCDMGDGRFYGHDVVGEEMTREIMRRLKYPNAQIERVARLVRNHMFYYPYVDDTTDVTKADSIQSHEWTDAAVRRFIARVGEENVDDLFELRIADAGGNPSASFKPEEIALLQSRIADVKKEDMALKVGDLAVTGQDIIGLGLPAGPRVGELLEFLLDKVIEDPLLNTKEKLLDIVKQELS